MNRCIYCIIIIIPTGFGINAHSYLGNWLFKRNICRITRNNKLEKLFHNICLANCLCFL